MEFMHTFNRTTVECKVFTMYRTFRIASFNRTTGMLKHLEAAIQAAKETFNRTTVECK